MNQSFDANEKWLLDEENVGLLICLCEALLGLAANAKSGNDLIAIGEALVAIRNIIDGQSVDVDVGLSVGFRRGDSDYEEGLFMCARINADNVMLDELNTTYSSDRGSDHFTRVYAWLRPDGETDTFEFNDWIDKLKEVRSCEDAQLETERDHI